MEVGPTDRVLLLSGAAPDDVRALAEQARDGIVVCVLGGDAVYEARLQLRDYPNVMVVPADPEGLLPWKEHFFTVIHAPSERQPTAEMRRVLAPGGTIWLQDGPVKCV